jgi:uncharacterized protein (DUF433 family)
VAGRWEVPGEVEAVRSFHHQEGYGRDQILAEYPSLVDADIDAALAFEERCAANA